MAVNGPIRSLLMILHFAEGKGAKGARARGPGALGLAPVVATAFFPLINLPNFILASLS